MGTAKRFSFLRIGPFAKVRRGRKAAPSWSRKAAAFAWVGRLAKPSVQVKRVYEPPSREHGVRVLVDRLWPRGLSKPAKRGRITLLYGARDVKHNNAVALYAYLSSRGE